MKRLVLILSAFALAACATVSERSVTQLIGLPHAALDAFGPPAENAAGPDGAQLRWTVNYVTPIAAGGKSAPTFARCDLLVHVSVDGMIETAALRGPYSACRNSDLAAKIDASLLRQ